MLILKQNAANSVPTPPAGKGTIFLDDSDTLSVKTSDGNVESFPTVGAANSQVVYMNGSTLSGEAALTYDFNNNVLNVSGNVAAGNVKTDNLLYANGTPWDLSDPGGSNTQIQFNDDESFGGSAAFTFNKSSNVVTMSGNLSVGNVGGANLVSANYVGGTLTTGVQPNITSVGTLSALSVTGNATAGNISATGDISGGTLTGPLTTASQPNITSVGTLSSLTVTGNATAGNVYANSGTIGASLLTGTLTTASQPNITSVGTLGSLAVTGTATAGNVYANSGTIGANIITGNTVGGTLTTAAQPNITSVGNLTGLTLEANADITLSGAGSQISGANLVDAAYLTGTLTTAAQPNITSTGTLTGLGVNGNITAANITANTGVFTGNGAGLTNIPGGNISGQSANALVAGTVYTNAQPNITSVGTLTSLGVSGGVTASTFTSNIANGTAPLVVTSTTKVANLNADLLDGLSTNSLNTGLTVVSRDADGSFAANIITATLSGAATTAGTVTTASQPNITSVGTLSSLTVTGTASAGNLSTGGNLSVSGTGSFGGNVAMGNFFITGLNTPVNGTDAATKQYVDDVAQGLNVHDSCAAATPDTLANITSGTITYNNGSNGVGAFLSTTGTFNLIDGVNVQTAGTRILVKNEANLVHNGIYTYTNTTAITRAADFNSVPEVEAGDFTFVTGGTLYDNTGWVQTLSPAGIGGASDNIEFTQFSGAGTYQAGTGLTLTGPTFSVNASQTQVTALGTVTTGTWNSLVGSSATFAAGLSGANLASITGANVSGQVAFANVANNVAGANVSGQVANALVAGTVYTNAQPNITSVGTLTSLGVSGAVTASTLVSNVATGTAPLTVTSTTLVGNLNVARANVSDLSTISSISTGNYYVSFVSATSGNLAESANSVYIANVANGSLAATTFVGAHSGNGATLTDLNASNISTGTLAQARLANSSLTVNGTAISLGGSGTVTATTTNSLTLGSYLTGGSFNGSGAVTAAVDATTTNTASKVVARDASGNFAAGTITATLSGAATTAGTVTTAAQPNITSVGTLTTLTVSGATSVTGNSALTTTNITSGANTTAGYMTGNWTLTTGSKFNATYADLAEMYISDAEYGPGTVLIFGGDKEVTLSNAHDSHAVAGVVSTKPAYLMNAGCEGEHTVELALQGRVPVKVHGPVAKGDLMVSGPNGHAVANNMARAGTIIGKALENFSDDHGVIEIAVGRF